MCISARACIYGFSVCIHVYIVLISLFITLRFEWNGLHYSREMLISRESWYILQQNKKY